MPPDPPSEVTASVSKTTAKLSNISLFANKSTLELCFNHLSNIILNINMVQSKKKVKLITFRVIKLL